MTVPFLPFNQSKATNFLIYQQALLSVEPVFTFGRVSFFLCRADSREIE